MWSRFDDQITHHPKIVKVGVRAAYLFFAGIIYCSRYRTDGYIPKEALAILAPMRDYKRLTKKLVEVRVPSSEHGLWEEVEGGYIIHDFLVYQPSAAVLAQKEEADRKRLRAARGAARGQGEDAAAEDASGEARELDGDAGVAATSRRRRGVPIPSPSPSPIPDRSRDPDPVCALEPRVLAGEEHTHTKAVGEEPVEERGPAPVMPNDTATEVARHLRSMPAPICHLATQAYAVRFASAALSGLGIDDICCAITAAGLKLGAHASARLEAPETIAALADHVGRFLANQTARPREQKARAAMPEGEAVGRVVKRWCALYAKHEGAPYVLTDEERAHVAEVFAQATQVAGESAPQLGGEVGELAERIAEHWMRQYLRDEGVNQYLAKARHPLRFLARGIATYGLPRVRRAAPQESAVEEVAAAAISGAEAVAMGREVLRRIEAGPGLAKAAARPGENAVAAGAE